MKKILFISGSLRKASLNTMLLEHAASFLSEHECSFLDYSDVPLLNQDEEFPPPDAVVRVRAEVAAADALFIASPEYNHSYSAALKNLIDWLSRPVAPGDYSTAVGRGKLVAICSCAGGSGGSFSLERLSELLDMLSCKVVEETTAIKLADRFGAQELVLTEEEASILKRECEALISLL